VLKEKCAEQGAFEVGGEAFVACEEVCRIVCLCSVSGLLFVLDDL
jgi:hypothetical protein